MFAVDSIQPNKGIECHPGVIILQALQSMLFTFDIGEILEAAMKHFNLPGLQYMKDSLLDGHIKSVGRQVLHVAI